MTIDQSGVICVYEINKNITKNLGHALLRIFIFLIIFIRISTTTIYVLETAEKHEIRLYKYEDFPLRWRITKLSCEMSQPPTA